MPLPPLLVLWRVTGHCDLACRFCEYSRQRPGPRGQTDAATALAFGAVLRDYAALSGRGVHISFLGGEPLGWPPLQTVAARLRRDYGLETGLTTNGTRLHLPRVQQHLMDDYDQVTISVDGLAHHHDAARQAPGLWARLRAGVSQLAKRKAQRGYGPLLRANTILMRSNVRALEALCAELAAWGVETVTFNALGDAGDPFFEQERLRPEDTAWLHAALPDLRARLAALGLRLQGSRLYLNRLDQRARALPWPIPDCGPGAERLFLDEYGRAAPCDATTAEYGVPITELRSASDLADLPQRLAEHRACRPLPACADCKSTGVFGKFAEFEDAPPGVGAFRLSTPHGQLPSGLVREAAGP